MLLTLFPFYWMLRTALSDNTQLAGNSDSLLPVETTLGAFKRVLGLATVEEAQAQGGSGASVNFWLYLRNSVVVSTVTTVCQVFFSAMAAYAFARLRWPGRDKVFAVFLAALMVPPIFTTLPNFVLIKNLGLLNSFAGIILPAAFMTPFASPTRAAPTVRRAGAGTPRRTAGSTPRASRGAPSSSTAIRSSPRRSAGGAA
jgi:multiple sugar transport system permease protein